MPSPTGYLFADVNTAHLVFHQEDPSSCPIAFVVAQGKNSSVFPLFHRFPFQPMPTGKQQQTVDDYFNGEVWKSAKCIEVCDLQIQYFSFLSMIYLTKLSVAKFLCRQPYMTVI